MNSPRKSVFNRDDWQFCLQVLMQIFGLDETFKSLSLKFIYGLALFHLKEVDPSFEVYKELARDADYFQGRRRIIRSFVASRGDGTPTVFNGTVSYVERGRNRGELFVQELRRNIRFIPTDFGRPEIQKGEAMNAFHIAFNFIGPIADPSSHYKKF